MTTERRKSPRLRSLLGGRVSFNQQRSTLDCIVRNMSEDGALILLSDAVALPEAFSLEIPNRQCSYAARVRWRNGERIGIAFATQASHAASGPVPLDLARRLKHCEQDNARLKSRVLQLTEPG